MLEKLVKLYNDGFSLRQLADKFGVDHMRIKRALVKAGVALRNSSEAQKNFLDKNPDKHPTKGKPRSEETKLKISKTYEEYLTEDEIQRRREAGKRAWDNKSSQEKEKIKTKMMDSFRQTAKKGSSLERFLVAQLSVAGYTPEFHKEAVIENEKMHIDIFLPKLQVAIELDGPTHYEPIFGEEQLLKVKDADNRKNGILLNNGMSVIRIRHPKTSVNKWRKHKLLEDLKSILDTKPVKQIISLEIK